MAETPIYYGEVKCISANCKNKAYFKGNLCGVHSRRLASKVPLPKRPKEEVLRLKENSFLEHKISIDAAIERNKEAGKKGQVILYRLQMMKSPGYVDGFVNVFPNYRHENRSDGYGCSALSPMKLGPVEHGQPDLPICKNIENFHQGSKCFQQEVDDPDLFKKNRETFYNDEEPHRHKYKGTEKNKNIPKYFVWIDGNGKEHHLDYVTSRQFYCNFYERLASVQEEYKKLLDMVENGTNIRICGYDAHEIKPGEQEKAYLDKDKAFGHERVLYTMITMSNDKDNYPWRKYKTFDF